jgi:hypothetical protein
MVHVYLASTILATVVAFIIIRVISSRRERWVGYALHEGPENSGWMSPDLGSPHFKPILNQYRNLDG